jgi:NADH:ubiquinone oxidoreductase subunit F (NADH-binding)
LEGTTSFRQALEVTAAGQAPQERAIASSFYHLSSVALQDQPCQGTACFVARHRGRDWDVVEGSTPRVYCLGSCYAAPATGRLVREPHVDARCATPVVLERIIAAVEPSLSSYADHGGYAGLERSVALTPDEVVTELERSGLRGRGGAGFPTGRKWRSVLSAADGPKVVVCNADEGDPGSYIDRFILEGDPHAVLEGMAIAGAALGADRGVIYVRKEYPAAAAAIRRAVEEASREGIVGERLLDRRTPFDVKVVDGQGSYVCGEETALVNALEGRRPEVRARPPYPATHGLFGRPTLVNNVETLASVGWILRRGGKAYAAMGHGESRGTKLVSLNSLFRRPGLYEVEFGAPVRDLVENAGGGVDGAALAGVLIGGPLAGILPPHLLDTPFAFEELEAAGAAVGHGGVVAFDEHTSILELLHHVFRFGAYESCGKCTPCRAGAADIEAITATALAAGRVDADDGARLVDIVGALGATSLCGHGIGLADFARSVLVHYREGLAGCLI